jgi:hypothetical protein
LESVSGHRIQSEPSRSEKGFQVCETCEYGGANHIATSSPAKSRRETWHQRQFTTQQ